MFFKLRLTVCLTICLLGCGADESAKISTEPVTIDGSVAPADIPIITLVEESVDDFKAKNPTIFYRLKADKPLKFDLDVYVEIQNELTSGGIRTKLSPLTISKNDSKSEEYTFGFGRWSVEFSVEIISLQELLDTQGSPEKKIRFSPGTKLKPYKLGIPSQLFHSRKEEVNGTP